MKMSPKIIQSRFELLKAMHTIVCRMNDETAYCEWIYLVPDCADDDDLMDIANPNPYDDPDFVYSKDNDLFDEACKLFRRLMYDYGTAGFYIWDDPTGEH